MKYQNNKISKDVLEVFIGFAKMQDMMKERNMDSGLIVVVFIITSLIITVFSFLLFVDYEWCHVLFKNNTVSKILNLARILLQCIFYLQLVKCIYEANLISDFIKSSPYTLLLLCFDVGNPITAHTAMTSANILSTTQEECFALQFCFVSSAFIREKPYKKMKFDQFFMLK